MKYIIIDEDNEEYHFYDSDTDVLADILAESFSDTNLADIAVYELGSPQRINIALVNEEKEQQ